MPAEPSYLDGITIQLVETAVLGFDSETLIAAFKDRVAGLTKKSLNGTQVAQIASEFSAKVGDVIVILFGDKINAAKDDTIIDATTALMTSIEETVVAALTRGSEIGFETPIQPHTDLLFRILKVPDEPVVAEVTVIHNQTEDVSVTAGEPALTSSDPVLAPSRPSLVSLSSPHRRRPEGEDEEMLTLIKSGGGAHQSNAFLAYCRQISKYNLLTREQEIELAERIKKGDSQARHDMICANLRLVIKIARDYENYGLPIMDLIEEGNMGLMKAIERFDPNKGGKLSTYAAWWIKQSIKRALANQSKTIRLPVHMVDKISKMRRVALALSEELGREPTDEELSEEIGIPRAKLAQLRVAGMHTASLDAPVSEDDGTEFGELVGDESAVNPLDALVDKNMIEQLEGLLEFLDPRELKIISARYGLYGQKARTLEEVGQEFGVTRERIRQLQNIAIKKMRKKLKNKDNPILRLLDEEEDDLDGARKTPKSALLNSDFLKNAAAQLAAHQGGGSVPKKPVPASSSPRQIPIIPTVRPPFHPVPPKKPVPPRTLAPKSASSTGSGNVMKDNTTRFIIQSYYLGKAGCIVHSIDEIAKELELPVADVRATLADMGILRG